MQLSDQHSACWLVEQCTAVVGLGDSAGCPESNNNCVHLVDTAWGIILVHLGHILPNAALCQSHTAFQFPSLC